MSTASSPPAQRARVLREAVATYRRHPQVAAVFTKAELAAAPAPSGPPDTWSLIQRAKASFDPERSGDFIVLLKPRVTPIFDTSRGYVATHGSPWDYDRRVPILFWRKGVTPFEQSLAVETADILPTLAATIGVTIPTGSDRRALPRPGRGAGVELPASPRPHGEGAMLKLGGVSASSHEPRLRLRGPAPPPFRVTAGFTQRQRLQPLRQLQPALLRRVPLRPRLVDRRGQRREALRVARVQVRIVQRFLPRRRRSGHWSSWIRSGRRS